MKRFLTIFILFTVITAFHAAAAEKAVIKSLMGKVEIKTGSYWKAATEGMELKPGTVISTGFKSNALIDTGSSDIFVKQLTRMSLDELSKSGNTVKTNLNLRLGRIKANVKTAKGLKHDFTLKTPVSTAAVRGTVFTSGVRSLIVESGSIRYANRIGQQVTVMGGTSSKMGLTGFSAPADMADAIEEAFSVAASTQLEDAADILTGALEDFLESDQTSLTIMASYAGI